jgi:hypothetical protein
MLYADCETGSARNHVQRAAKRAGFKVEKFAGLENSREREREREGAK